jgi:hypothetical protein
MTHLALGSWRPPEATTDYLCRRTMQSDEPLLVFDGHVVGPESISMVTRERRRTRLPATGSCRPMRESSCVRRTGFGMSLAPTRTFIASHGVMPTTFGTVTRSVSPFEQSSMTAPCDNFCAQSRAKALLKCGPLPLAPWCSDEPHAGSSSAAVRQRARAAARIPRRYSSDMGHEAWREAHLCVPRNAQVTKGGDSTHTRALRAPIQQGLVDADVVDILLAEHLEDVRVRSVRRCRSQACRHPPSSY